MSVSEFSQHNTRSWSMSLGNENESETSVQWLRTEFLELRERAGYLLGEIARDLPDFTQHDVSHCDALWEMADHIGGESLDLNPAEGFVLGAVFLLHDAALCLAALPNRMSDLQKESLWLDTTVNILKTQLNRSPTDEEIEAVKDGKDKYTQQKVAATVLRMKHADFAERLALQPFNNKNGTESFLIQNEDLRTHYGRDIGRIAASHGLVLETVSRNFAPLPPLPPIAGKCPNTWNVDRLKLACLIRTCDAIHLDSRRAPSFLRSIRQPDTYSNLHWQFQQYISVNRDTSNRITFSSGHAFECAEARAWWTGYELIQNADRELRQVDALLADTNKPRFMARSVRGVESPERLKETIPTDNWEPVEARIRVSNVAQLARNLGGESLYGKDSTGVVPLRELIQNASDAIHVRQLLDQNNAYTRHGLGEIILRQGLDQYGQWIEVEDNGLGMSVNVLTKTLLDFGTSLWNTDKQYEEWPGLSGHGFESIGRFGIGFFSVFMWGERIQVISRRFDQPRESTRVLEWEKGIEWHPLLRHPSSSEFLNDGGTRVRVWISKNEDEQQQRNWDLEKICTSLCPSLGVNLSIEKETVYLPSFQFAKKSMTSQPIVKAHDWIDCDGKELLRRVWSDYHNFSDLRSPELLESFAQVIRPLYHDKDIVGRACLCDWRSGFELFGTANYRTGAVTTGGLLANELTGIGGILLGRETRASRDAAIPVVSGEELARWATEQAPLYSSVTTDFNRQTATSTAVRMCGGQTGPLFITATGHPEGWLQLSHNDIVEMEDFPDEIIFMDFSILDGARLAQSIRLHNNVFLTRFDLPSLLFKSDGMRFIDWNLEMPARVAQVINPDWKTRYRTLFGALIEAVAERWQCSIDDVMAASTLQNANDAPAEEREIGFIHDKPIVQQVGLLRRPK